MAGPTNVYQIQFFAGIGHVCLQWALLETTLLAVLNVLENLPTDEGAIMFGGLDVHKRLNMAINLSAHHKAPPHIIRQLKDIRITLQKEKGGLDLADRRNQVVHGAHKDALDPQAVTLTMFSWNKAKREREVKFEDLAVLAEEIHALQRRVYRVFEDIGPWKYPGHGEVNRSNDLGSTPPAVRVKLTQGPYAGLKHFWRRLFG